MIMLMERWELDFGVIDGLSESGVLCVRDILVCYTSSLCTGHQKGIRKVYGVIMAASGLRFLIRRRWFGWWWKAHLS